MYYRMLQMMQLQISMISRMLNQQKIYYRR
nr:MAG TPA: hypothetical protein [Caudoviricetes sp.]